MASRDRADFYEVLREINRPFDVFCTHVPASGYQYVMLFLQHMPRRTAPDLPPFFSRCEAWGGATDSARPRDRTTCWPSPLSKPCQMRTFWLSLMRVALPRKIRVSDTVVETIMTEADAVRRVAQMTRAERLALAARYLPPPPDVLELAGITPAPDAPAPGLSPRRRRVPAQATTHETSSAATPSNH